MEPCYLLLQWAAGHRDYAGKQMESLACGQCRQPKTLSEMSKDRAQKSGHRGICKACAATRTTQYRAENSDKYKATLRRCARKRRYGLDGIAHFEEQRKLQAGLCAICLQPMAKACSDHDHENNQWRGMLCDCCNRGLGLLKDSVSVLEAAIAYLKKWHAAAKSV